MSSVDFFERRGRGEADFGRTHANGWTILLVEVVDGVAPLPRQVDVQHPRPGKFSCKWTGDISQRIPKIPILPMSQLAGDRQ